MIRLDNLLGPTPEYNKAPGGDDAQRQPLAEIQRNLEFKDTPLPLGGAVKRPTASVDAAPSAPSFSTPAESSSAAEQRRAAAAAAGPGLSVLYWDDPFQTGILFGLTVATFAAFTYAAYGRHGITFMQGVSYFLLADLGAAFLRSLVSRQWAEASAWTDSTLTRFLIYKATQVINGYAHLHDRYLSVANPWAALRSVLGLWAFSALASTVSAWTLTLLTILAAFTLPAAYHRQRRLVDAQVQNVLSMANQQLDALKLGRGAKLGGSAAALALAFVFLSWTSRAIGLLALLMYARACMTPREVETLRNRAEPLTMSVHAKVAPHFNSAYQKLTRSVMKPAKRTD